MSATDAVSGSDDELDDEEVDVEELEVRSAWRPCSINDDTWLMASSARQRPLLTRLETRSVTCGAYSDSLLRMSLPRIGARTSAAAAPTAAPVRRPEINPIPDEDSLIDVESNDDEDEPIDEE